MPQNVQAPHSSRRFKIREHPKSLLCSQASFPINLRVNITLYVHTRVHVANGQGKGNSSIYWLQIPATTPIPETTMSTYSHGCKVLSDQCTQCCFRNRSGCGNLRPIYRRVSLEPSKVPLSRFLELQQTTRRPRRPTQSENCLRARRPPRLRRGSGPARARASGLSCRISV